ncbi:MAG TPA: hypothetical protein VFB63_19600 [Bryobacteraceae bacterium]|nr:hypothetical protein [Bryobacteraceae bacterium]
MKLHHDETATILAALRWYQRALVARGEVPPTEVAAIATNEGDLEPLDSAGVDDLCERINCDTDGIGADESAQRIACSVNAVTQIVALLDGKEWDSETICAVANILREEGFPVRDLDDEEEADGG